MSARDGNRPSGEGVEVLHARDTQRHPKWHPKWHPHETSRGCGAAGPRPDAGGRTGTAVAAASPGHTIASAGTLSIGSKTSGGGDAIDFWKVHLNGGDQIQISTTYPEFNNYVFALYAPGTTDGSFPQAATFSSGVVNDNTTKSVIVLGAL